MFSDRGLPVWGGSGGGGIVVVVVVAKMEGRYTMTRQAGLTCG